MVNVLLTYNVSCNVPVLLILICKANMPPANVSKRAKTEQKRSDAAVISGEVGYL